jgi:hypothetical protein
MTVFKDRETPGACHKKFENIPKSDALTEHMVAKRQMQLTEEMRNWSV